MLRCWSAYDPFYGRLKGRLAGLEKQEKAVMLAALKRGAEASRYM